MSNALEVAATVDASGLACPMPILRARKGMDALPGGAILELIATDKGSLKDVQEWAKIAGHEVVEWQESSGSFHYFIRKKSS